MKKKIAILVLIILCIFTTGCKNNTSENKVTETFNSLKSLDDETLKTYFSKENGKGASDISYAFTKAYFKKFDYKIIKVKENKKTSKVTVNISCIDTENLSNLFTSQALAYSLTEEGLALSEEEMQLKLDEMLLALMNSKDIKMKESQVIINLKKEKGKWQIIVNDELKNAITSGSIEELPPTKQ